MGTTGFAIQFNLDGKPQLLLTSCRVGRTDVEVELANLRFRSKRTNARHWFKKATDVQIVPVTIVVTADAGA